MRPKTAVIGTFVAVLAAGTATSDPVPWPTYRDETSTRLVAASGIGNADVQEKDYAWGDVDRDGDIDLVAVRKEPFNTPGRFRNVLFMNEGVAEGHAFDGVLVDRTADLATAATDGGLGLLDPTADRDVALVDVDGDEWLDIVTSTTYGDTLPKTISHPRVYINLREIGGVWQGFRYEEDRTPTMPIAPNFCGMGVGDVTGDELADLYFVDYNNDLEDRLWINRGDGSFRDESEARMSFEMRESDFGVHAVIADMNDDGKNDIVKDRGSTASTPPLRVSVSYNDGVTEGLFNTFEVLYNGNPYHVAVGDLNDDNLLDVIIEDDGTDRYYLNQGNGVDGLADFIGFTFSTESDSFGGNIVIDDVNNDGYQDVLIADVDVDCCGCTRSMRAWRGLGGDPPAFDAQTGGIPVADRTGTHDIALFDIDGDGWKDMVLGTCSGTSVWMADPVVDLTQSYPAGLPALLTPAQPTEFQVELTPFGGPLEAASAQLHVSINDGPFMTSPLLPIGGDLYVATLPAASCFDDVTFYTSAAVAGVTFLDPPDAPTTVYRVSVATGVEIALETDVEGDISGWSVVNGPALTAGGWEAAEPNGTIDGLGQAAAPDDDAEAAGVRAFVTQNGAVGGPAGAADVDGGPTDLISPPVDLSGADAEIGYSRWFYSNGPGDSLTVWVSGNGNDWELVETVGENENTWQGASFRVGSFVAPTAAVQVRFRTSDEPNDSITEGGVDLFRVERLVCDGSGAAGSVPDGGGVPGPPLLLTKAAGDSLALSWGASCETTDSDYTVNEGTLGDLADHVPRLCTTGGLTSATLAPAAGNTYYLVVPTNGMFEGSYGNDSAGAPRPPSGSACLPQSAAACR